MPMIARMRCTFFMISSILRVSGANFKFRRKILYAVLSLSYPEYKGLARKFYKWLFEGEKFSIIVTTEKGMRG